MNIRTFVFAWAVIVSAIEQCCEAQTSVVVDNLHFELVVSSLGETGPAYYAQSFVAEAERLTDVTFVLASGHGPDPTDFRMLVTETTELAGGGVHPTAVLFESQDLHLPLNPTAPQSLADYTQFVVNVGNLPLQLGMTYAFVLDNFVSFNGIENGAQSALNNDYADGNFLYYAGPASGGNRIAHFADANNWINWRPGTLNDHDLAFRLVFNIPEPSALGLLTMGLICTCSTRRSRAQPTALL